MAVSLEHFTVRTLKMLYAHLDTRMTDSCAAY